MDFAIKAKFSEEKWLLWMKELVSKNHSFYLVGISVGFCVSA